MDEMAARDAIHRRLGSGEKVLWVGRPPTGLLLRPSDFYLIPFTLMWGGFAIFWEASVLSGPASLFFTLWGIPFVLVGLYMIAGRFIVDAWLRSKTVYGVTNERVIILSGLAGPTVKSLDHRTLGGIELSEGRGERGTITFGTAGASWWQNDGMWPGLSGQGVPKFEAIPEARRVYEIIRQAQRQAS